MGYGFLFLSEFFFRTTQELEYILFCRTKHKIIFQNLTLGYMSKTLNQIFFFPPPKSEYFFQQHWESEYFFRKKPYPPPFKLKSRSLRTGLKVDCVDNLSAIESIQCLVLFFFVQCNLISFLPVQISAYSIHV